MTITLKPITLERLREKAAQDGRDLDETADLLILSVLDREAWEREEAVQGIQQGLDDFAAGRYCSARDVFSEIKAQHGIGD